MRKELLLLFLALITYGFTGEFKLKYDYPIQPVNFWNVKIEEGFWKQKLETNRKVTIPYLFKMNEETGRVDNFRIAGGLKKGLLSGDKFFYQNPLASKGDYERSRWFQVAFCPANLARFSAQFPQFIYAISDEEIFINLFVSSKANFEFKK